MHTTIAHSTTKKVDQGKKHVSWLGEGNHKKDVVDIIGRVASALSVIMYVSYIPQIMNNLAGHPGSPFQPLAALFNCVMWTAYGLLKPQKDWPIVIANVPGIFLAGITFATSFMG